MSSDTPPIKLYTALLAAMKQMGPVRKDAKNPAFRSTYATLQSVMDTVEQPLWDNGLLLMQEFQYDRINGDGRPILITQLIHAASGEYKESVITVDCGDPQNPQKVGGAITYYRRYAILSLLALSTEDDDGHAASQPRSQPQAQRPTPAPQAQPRPVQPQPAAPPAPALAPDDPLAPVLATLRQMEAKPEPWAVIKQFADTQSEIADDYGKQAIRDTLHAIAARRKAAAPKIELPYAGVAG